MSRLNIYGSNGMNDMLKCFGISKFNPHHDERGRFTYADNAVAPRVASAAEAFDLDINNFPGIKPTSPASESTITVAANGILDMLKPDGEWIAEVGNGPDVKIMAFGYKQERGLKAAEKFFNEATDVEGAVDITPKRYPGKLVQLPNGDIIGLRPVSTSGLPTVDINSAGSVGILRLKFTP